MSGIVENLRGRRWLIIIAVLLVFVCCLVLAFTPIGKVLADFVGINLGGGGTPEVTPTTEVTEQATTELTLPPTDETTETVEPTREVTEETTPEVTSTIEVGKGTCNERCDPANSNCLAGLECLPVAGTDKYVCWNSTICQGTSEPTAETTPEVTQPPGPTDPCAKEVCGDGYCSTCPVDHAPGCCDCGAVCGDGVCACGETGWSCGVDCGVP